jgi:hypothetical protein
MRCSVTLKGYKYCPELQVGPVLSYATTIKPDQVETFSPHPVSSFRPAATMDIVFDLFRDAHLTGKGYQLSETLTPVAPPNQPDRLYGFYRSTNAANVQKDIRYNVLYDSTTSLRLSTEEGNSWVEVYVAYWKAVGEILRNEEVRRTNSQV